MISSTLMEGQYDRLVVNYNPYRERQVEALVQGDQEGVEGGGSIPPSAMEDEAFNS
jgi:hypothetical protein